MLRKPLYQQPTPKSRLKRVLLVMMVFSFVAALLMAIFYSCTSSTGYTDYMNVDEIQLIQLEKPAEGAPTATVSTTLGEISFVLYPEEAPKAVENFQSLAKTGFYDNTYIFRVEDGVFFAGGAKTVDGELGDSYDEANEKVEQELSNNLWPFRGALCALTTGSEGGFVDRFLGNITYYNGSRFVVTNSIEFTDEIKEELFKDNEGNKVAQAFVDQGGVPNYSRQLTIFGQAYAGLDVLDEITHVALTGEDNNHRPAEDILIQSVTLGEYGK